MEGCIFLTSFCSAYTTHTSRASHAALNSCDCRKFSTLATDVATPRNNPEPTGLKCCSSFCFGFVAFHRLSCRKSLGIAKLRAQGWRSLVRSLSISVSLFVSSCLFLLVSLRRSPSRPLSPSLSLCLSLPLIVSPYLSLSVSVCLTLCLSPSLCIACAFGLNPQQTYSWMQPVPSFATSGFVNKENCQGFDTLGNPASLRPHRSLTVRRS